MSQEQQDLADDKPLEIDASVPKLYVNVFGVGIGRSDIVIVARHNDADIAAISMSFTTAKTLAQSLGQVIAYLESKTGAAILTIDELEGKLLESSPNGDES